MDPRHLEHHQASPDRAAMGLSLVGLVRDVASRHMDPVCVVQSGLKHGPATSWPQHCQLRRNKYVGRDTHPLAQAAPGKEYLSSCLQVTKLAWLKTTSYPGMRLMVAQGPVKRQEGEEASNGLCLLQRGGGT